MSKSVIIASDGQPYSMYRLHKIASGIVSKRVPVRVFNKNFNKIITEALTVNTAAKFMRTVMSEDLRGKILIDPNGYVLGGEMALIKALFKGTAAVRVVKFANWEDIEMACVPDHKRTPGHATVKCDAHAIQ
jgi:hypothetical protein